MAEIHSFVLKFISNTAEKISLTIPRAEKSLSASYVEQCMNDLIGTGIILTANGRPATVDGAELVTVTLDRRV